MGTTLTAPCVRRGDEGGVDPCVLAAIIDSPPVGAGVLASDVKARAGGGVADDCVVCARAATDVHCAPGGQKRGGRCGRGGGLGGVGGGGCWGGRGNRRRRVGRRRRGCGRRSRAQAGFESCNPVFEHVDLALVRLGGAERGDPARKRVDARRQVFQRQRRLCLQLRDGEQEQENNRDCGDESLVFALHGRSSWLEKDGCNPREQTLGQVGEGGAVARLMEVGPGTARRGR